MEVNQGAALLLSVFDMGVSGPTPGTALFLLLEGSP